MKPVYIVALCMLVSCGAAPRPVAHPTAPRKYGYFSGPTITGTVTSVTAGSGLTGGTITRSGTIAVDTSTTQSRVSGACTGANAIQTINADGTVTCVAGGGGGGGTVTSVATGTGLTGGPITTTGTVSLANTAVTAGNYTLPAITVDAQGRLTAASSYAGTSCGAGTAIQLLSTAGAASCVTVGTGTVTSIAAAAPLSGGTITTSGTVGLNESSNLRNNGTALDLSTAVTMPGSLTVKSLAGTAQAVSTSGSTDDVALAANTTVVNYTGAADATWGGFVNTGERWIYVANTTSNVLTLENEDSSTTAADRIKNPNIGSNGFQIPPNSGTWIHYDTVNSRWNLSGLVGTACGAGEFIDSINPDGSANCATPTAGITGSGTTGDMMKWSGSTAATNYGGSTPSACTAGSVTTQPTLSAAGAVANNCTALTSVANSSGAGSTTNFLRGDGTWAAPSTNAASANVVLKSDGAGNAVASSITDDGTRVRIGDNLIDSTNTSSLLQIGNSSSGVRLGASGKTTEDLGLLQVDGNTQLGASWSAPVTVEGQPKCSGTTTTVTGSGATIVGTNCSGIITLGSSLSTFTLNFDASHPWSNTPPCVFEYVASGSDAHWVSAQSTTAVTVHFATATTGSVNYQCGWGY